MPHYGWVGPGKTRELELSRAQAPTVAEPTDVAVQAPKKSLHRCTVEGCGKKFKKRMIVARHFNANHEDLREDKDSWREFVEEVGG